jgi:hypothetical protein
MGGNKVFLDTQHHSEMIFTKFLFQVVAEGRSQAKTLQRRFKTTLTTLLHPPP